MLCNPEGTHHRIRYLLNHSVTKRGEQDTLVLAVIQCGVESVAMNAFVYRNTNLKKLQYGPEKCHQLHVGKNTGVCPELFIDEWKLVKKDELVTGIDNLVDVMENVHKVESVKNDSYLGDIISVDGRNTKHIAAKRAKAIGIKKQIINILEDMCLGPYFLRWP